MSDTDPQPISPRAFERERRARKESERLLEEKSRELFELNSRLASLNAELEDRVASRTRELVDATARAEEASAAKTRFLAVMSHELRTPLTSILGYTELMREAELTAEERREFLQVIHRGGEHLLEMIERVLQIAELDGDRSADKLAPVDLPALLEDALERVRATVEERELRIVLRADVPVPRLIETVGPRLRGAVLAILENAVRFTEQGGVHVVVGFSHAAAEAASCPPSPPSPESSRIEDHHAAERSPMGLLRIEIADSGSGISEADLERVFEPFEQVEGGMNRRWDGPGLGLTIARRSARALGGDVTLSSTLGAGSTFRIEIPVAASRTGGWLRFGDHMPLPRRGVRDAAAGRPIEGLRILLAEDQVEIRWLVRQVLERAGASVIEVGDGEQLVAAADSADVDLIVTDLQMPRCDGYTAIRRLRTAGFDRPAIALTAHALGEDMRDAGEAGCDDYLVKPIDPARLIDACLRWQGRRHHIVEPSTTEGPDVPGSSRATEGGSGSGSGRAGEATGETDADGRADGGPSRPDGGLEDRGHPPAAS